MQDRKSQTGRTRGNPAHAPARVPQLPVPVEVSAERETGSVGWPPLLRFVGRFCTHVLMVVLPLVLLVALGAGLGYVRLHHGPVSLKVLARPIERGIEAELPGTRVRIGDVIIALAPKGGLEFRLRNLAISEADGDLIASAPLAAVELSGSALKSWRIVPSRVDLIEPALSVGFSEDGRLALSFAPGPVDGQTHISTTEGPPPQPTHAPDFAPPASPTSAVGPRGVDLLQMFADASARARQRLDAASFLREVGVRNAIVVVDRGGRKTRWTVPEMSVDLEHRRRRSVVSGSATIATSRGSWTLSFWTEDNEGASGRALNIKSSIRGIQPAMLTSLLPELTGLDLVEIPISADSSLDVSPGGKIASGRFSIELGRGQIRIPAVNETSMPVDGGLITITYDGTARQFELASSTLVSGKSRLNLVGKMTALEQSGGGTIWPFVVETREGVLAAEDFGLPPLSVSKATAEGVLLPEQGKLTLRSAAMSVAGTEGRMHGEIATSAGRISARLEGTMSPTGAGTLKTIWPRVLAPAARQWVGERLSRATLKTSSFRFANGTYLAEQERSPSADYRLTASIESSDIQFTVDAASPPIEAPRALTRIENETVEVTIPDATGIVSAKGRVPLKGIRFFIADSRPDIPMGEVTFRTLAPLNSMLELADRPPYELLKKSGIKPEAVDGKFEGQFKMVWPLTPALDTADVKVEGKARISEGRGRQIVGNYDVQGASVSFDVSDKAIDAKGEMLVSGVPTKLSWQRIFDAPPDKQPPLRVTATIDNSDRTQLGLDINHVVQGEVGLEVTVALVPQSDPKVQLRADLTNAELVLENMAWKKPSGRVAILQCDVAKSKVHKLELQNLKLAGDDIAVEGWGAIGADNGLREFHFPDFSLNVVTRLEVQGTLRPDNVWEVKAKGATFDGRDFFRSLFHVGQISEKAIKPLKPRAGIDLDAEIGTIIGFSEVSLRGLKLRFSRRAEKLTVLDATATLDGGAPVAVQFRAGSPSEPRRLLADSMDAGQAFKLVGFYPNAQGGRVRLEVNLDGRGSAEKTGTLWVENFRVLGDPVVSEVVGSVDGSRPAIAEGKRAGPQMVRETFDFDRMKVPFSVGHGQFVIDDSYLKGPLLGASIRGKVDFNAKLINLGGTYVPLQGLNNALGDIPLFGQILSGPRGEGIFGITFAVQGPMAQPQVVVNPLSILTPGFTRGLMEVANPDTAVRPVEEPRPATPPEKRVRASSTPAEAGPPPVKGPGPAKSAPAPAPRAVPTSPTTIDGWSSTTAPTKPRAN